jgi:hypothetical protein
MAGAYRVIDRRGSANQPVRGYLTQTNNLYPAATPNSDRRSVPSLDYDGYNLVTPQGRRNLMTAGRRLMASNSVVRAAVNDMVRLSASNYQMHFHTSDNEWNNKAETLLRQHDLICDSRGQGYNMRTITEFLVKGPVVDGDVGVMKYFTPSGYPMFQMVPSHRITSPLSLGSGIISGGKYDGRRYIDGVIVNEFLRPLAYLVAVGSDQKTSADVMSVPAQDMLLSYVPEYTDQVRGYSQLGASIFDWQDIQDTRRFDLIGRKARASKAIIVHNESGEADETQRMLSMDDRTFTDSELTAVTRETIEGGTIEYYKSSSNVRLESVKDDRPSTNGMEFDRTITRDALAGIGWSYDYAIDPTKAGGAQMRVVIEKINRTILHIQRTLIEPCRRDLDNWRLNVFMARGDLEYNEEWSKYRYQVPAKLTADAKYQSQVDIAELVAGFTTHERIAANRSSNWEDDQDQWLREVQRLMDKAEEMGIDKNLVISRAFNTNILSQFFAQENAQANSENSQ